MYPAHCAGYTLVKIKIKESQGPELPVGCCISLTQPLYLDLFYVVWLLVVSHGQKIRHVWNSETLNMVEGWPAPTLPLNFKSNMIVSSWSKVAKRKILLYMSYREEEAEVVEDDDENCGNGVLIKGYIFRNSRYDRQE